MCRGEPGVEATWKDLRLSVHVANHVASLFESPIYHRPRKCKYSYYNKCMYVSWFHVINPYGPFTNGIRVTIVYYTHHFLDENTGYGTTAATLNVRERQKYERLFGSAMIQYRSLCIDKGIGEGEQYVCGPGIYEVYRSLAYMVTGPSNMKKGFWQKLVSHALIHFDVHTLFCLLCCYCMVICLHQFTCMQVHLARSIQAVWSWKALGE